jgi:hypothetical protein
MKVWTACSLALVLTLANVSDHNSVRAALITNGNFESGNTGFTSGYDYSDVSDPGTWPAGIPFYPLGSAKRYTLVDNPHQAHWRASSFGDHTTGSGLMMAVNGADIYGQGAILWSETVSVAPGTRYELSAWLATWFTNSPIDLAELQFSINDQVVGTKVALGNAGVWDQFSAIWNSGSATTAEIKIVDLNLEGGGNDFALDDISLTPTAVPEPASIVIWSLLGGVGCVVAYRRRRKAAQD